MSSKVMRRELATHDPDFRVLEWDSAKFGFRVARVCQSTATDALPNVVERMKSQGVLLAYYSIPETRAALSDRVVAQVGAVLVDTRITFIRRAEDVPSQRSGGQTAAGEIEIQSYTGSESDPALIELARQAGDYSRFRVDPRISTDVFHRIYDAWLVRSVRREIANEVFVATLNGRLAGLLTLSIDGKRGEIGLLSVGPEFRGRGLGTRLAELGCAWARQQGCPETRVATQMSNRAACAVYLAAKYQIENRERTYHFWLAER